MFARFSPAAKRVVRAAEQACRSHNHYYVGVEHLLLALLEEHDPTVDARLNARGVRLDEVHAELRQTLGTGDDRLWDGILVTPRLRSVVALAESSVADGAQIEPVDLFEAIVAEGGGLAAELLARASGNLSDSPRVAG